MKGHSRVFTGGRLPVFWFIPFLFAHPISSISSLEVTWRWSQGLPHNYCSTSGGRASKMEASSPSPSGPLGDETVRWAKPASTPIASPPVSRSSSSWETGLRWRWDNTLFIHLHGMAFSWRGIRGQSRGAL